MITNDNLLKYKRLEEFKFKKANKTKSPTEAPNASEWNLIQICYTKDGKSSFSSNSVEYSPSSLSFFFLSILSKIASAVAGKNIIDKAPLPDRHRSLKLDMLEKIHKICNY